jgi:hypothetical protein
MKTTESVAAELHAVDEIVQALDVTLHETERPDTPRCISHGVEFLEDHLQRLYGLEESSGLLAIILSVHPELSCEAQRLQAEHDTIRAEAHRLVLALEDSHAPSNDSLQNIMRELRMLIAHILSHEHHERVVLLDSANIDQGGEG